MNDVGFISPVISSLPYELSAYEPVQWDRQTVVLLCDVGVDINGLRRHFRKIHRPNATSSGCSYEIDIFVNLNYKKGEVDPANRTVRIIYCSREDMTIESINNRFPNSYIMCVKERSELNGTPRISREIPQISCRTRHAR